MRVVGLGPQVNCRADVREGRPRESKRQSEPSKMGAIPLVTCGPALQGMTTAEAAQLLKAKFVVHDMLDEPALAADFGARSALSRADPYYHFTSATQAYEREQYAASLASLRKAPRLKPDERAFQ